MNDVRRVAFVSERFLELQGLAAALMGGALIFSAWLSRATGGAQRAFDAFLVFLLATVTAGLAAVPLQRAYRRTFGDIVATNSQRARAGLVTFVIYGGGLLDMYLGTLQSPRSGPSLAAVATAAMGCWIVARDWRWRSYYLGAVAGGLAGAIVTAAVAPAPDPFGADAARAEAFLLAYCLIGLGLLFSGLLDHHLLMSSLHPAEPDAGEEAARQRRAGKAAMWIGVCVVVPVAGTLTLSERRLLMALPGTLLLGLLVATIGFACTRAFHAWRDWRRHGRVTDEGVRVDFDDDVLGAMLFVGLSLAVAVVLPPAVSLTLPAAAIGLAGVFLALSQWPKRRHDLIWVIAAAACLLVTPRVPLMRAFAVFVAVMASAWTARAATAIVTSSENATHADTI